MIQAEFGLKGFAIVVKLYQKIYGGFGYYCEWNEESLLLFMSENGVSSREEKNLIDEIVSACIRRDIFSEAIYKKYGVLTSVGVQKRYLRYTSKCEIVNLKKEYLLLSDDKINANVVIIEDSVDRIEENVSRISQSREEKSRVENNINTLCKTDALALFESLWKLYPVKKVLYIYIMRYKFFYDNYKGRENATWQPKNILKFGKKPGHKRHMRQNTH